jgi:hypothetical protein
MHAAYFAATAPLALSLSAKCGVGPPPPEGALPSKLPAPEDVVVVVAPAMLATPGEPPEPPHPAVVAATTEIVVSMVRRERVVMSAVVARTG